METFSGEKREKTKIMVYEKENLLKLGRGRIRHTPLSSLFIMIKQTFYLLYILLQFYLSSLLAEEYFAKLNQFYRAGAARKKIPRAGTAWENNQKPEPLEKIGAGAAKN